VRIMKNENEKCLQEKVKKKRGRARWEEGEKKGMGGDWFKLYRVRWAGRLAVVLAS